MIRASITSAPPRKKSGFGIFSFGTEIEEADFGEVDRIISSRRDSRTNLFTDSEDGSRNGVTSRTRRTEVEI